MLICACECTRAQGKVRSVWSLRAHVDYREFEAAEGYASGLGKSSTTEKNPDRQPNARSTLGPRFLPGLTLWGHWCSAWTEGLWATPRPVLGPVETLMFLFQSPHVGTHHSVQICLLGRRAGPPWKEGWAGLLSHFCQTLLLYGRPKKCLFDDDQREAVLTPLPRAEQPGF